MYGVNYRLAAVGTEYLNADAAPSPLQHFWSLAVEEQFYLVWPLVIWFLARQARRLRADLGLVLAVVWVASLLACVVVTERSQPWAFYSLPTRAWELATGATIAAMLPSLRRLRRAGRVDVRALRPASARARRPAVHALRWPDGAGCHVLPRLQPAALAHHRALGAVAGRPCARTRRPLEAR